MSSDIDRKLQALANRIELLEDRVSTIQMQSKSAIDLYRSIQVEDESSIRQLTDDIRAIKAMIKTLKE